MPRDDGLAGLSCLTTRWCEAVGGWRSKLQVGHWNGVRWSLGSDIPSPPGAALSALTCRSAHSCVAVGELFPHETKPINPLIERWDGRQWHVEAVPKPAAPAGYRGGVNTRLMAAACPGARLCFAVGQAVPFGAGNAPGVPLIERWDGRRWRLMGSPSGAGAPLQSISCTSTRACTAVGGFEHEVGSPDANNQQLEYPTTIERWNGRSWSLGSLAAPSGSGGAGLLGVACTSASTCLGVGTEVQAGTYIHQAIAAPGNGLTFDGSALAYPSSAYRGGTGSPETALLGVACAPTDSYFCAAVGTYNATNGAIGPLAAIWNGSSWTQVALRRGPVELSSVACPALGWCMALGGAIAEKFG